MSTVLICSMERGRVASCCVRRCAAAPSRARGGSPAEPSRRSPGRGERRTAHACGRRCGHPGTDTPRPGTPTSLASGSGAHGGLVSVHGAGLRASPALRLWLTTSDGVHSRLPGQQPGCNAATHSLGSATHCGGASTPSEQSGKSASTAEHLSQRLDRRHCARLDAAHQRSDALAPHSAVSCLARPARLCFGLYRPTASAWAIRRSAGSSGSQASTNHRRGDIYAYPSRQRPGSWSQPRAASSGVPRSRDGDECPAPPARRDRSGIRADVPVPAPLAAERALAVLLASCPRRLLGVRLAQALAVTHRSVPGGRGRR